MSPSPSFVPFKKFQVMLVFASLTILYLIYSLGSSGYPYSTPNDEFSSPSSLSLLNPFGQDGKFSEVSEVGEIGDASEASVVTEVSEVGEVNEVNEVSEDSEDSEVKEVSEDKDVNEPSEVNPATPDIDEYVAFCVAHRNQRRDLPEFLTHHYYHHGIRRFYIMDDRSEPPLSSFKDFGIPRSALSFQYYDEQSQQPDMQKHIYAECARLYGNQHTWLAFIDADEFFETSGNDTLPSILHELDKVKHVGALGVNWRLHSSANLTTRPDSMRQSFTSCVSDPEIIPVEDLPFYKDNRLIKSIVKTSLFVQPLSPHMFQTQNGTYTVGEHGDRIDFGDGIRQPITRDRIGLHHYTVKSREQFEEKMESWTLKGWQYWDHIEGLPQEHCEEMKRYDP